ncbi:Serine/threonine-protein kinase ulk2 [Perkinsus chesapeaki]|uniref:Serine/threonine-protein kinase ulk2 n=1 Tax=Perkinsus chesapeaki TaxID=330153 RepID=A0A7J6MSS7_PERCH|nr:Serine/threonine-protein kinase ulk2 [Perkinsus chesapeaki]
MSGERKVYVGNLEEGTREEELEAVFKRYGGLESVWVARNPPGFAFVTFDDARDADDACRGEDGKDFNGRSMRVEIARRKSGKGKGKGKGYSNWYRGGDREYGSGGYGGGYGGGRDRKGRKVFVGNLDPGVRPGDLERIFERYGRIEQTWVARNPPGFAFITYCDSRDAKDAVDSEDGRDFQGKRMRVEISVSRNERGGRGRSMWERGGGPSRRSRSRSRDRRERRSRSRSDSRREKRRSRYDRYRSRSRSSSGSRSGSELSPSQSKEAFRRLLPVFRCGGGSLCGQNSKEQFGSDDAESRCHLKSNEIDPESIIKEDLTDDELVDYGIQFAQCASVAKSNGKKLYYLHFSKDFLMEALGRQQRSLAANRSLNRGDGGSPQWNEVDIDSSIAASESLRAHLAAVLVTLGEDPNVIREKLFLREVREEAGGDGEESLVGQTAEAEGYDSLRSDASNNDASAAAVRECIAFDSPAPPPAAAAQSGDADKVSSSTGRSKGSRKASTTKSKKVPLPPAKLTIEVPKSRSVERQRVKSVEVLDAGASGGSSLFLEPTTHSLQRTMLSMSRSYAPLGGLSIDEDHEDAGYMRLDSMECRECPPGSALWSSPPSEVDEGCCKAAMMTSASGGMLMLSSMPSLLELSDDHRMRLVSVSNRSLMAPSPSMAAAASSIGTITAANCPMGSPSLSSCASLPRTCSNTSLAPAMSPSIYDRTRDAARSAAADDLRLQVRIHNGVSGEEQSRFELPLAQAGGSPDSVLYTLDRFCQHFSSCPIQRLQWLCHDGDRVTRERCDLRMLASALDHPSPLPPLLLCTVPMTPACEMGVFVPRQGEGDTVRLKSLYPRRVAGTGPVELRLGTSYLPEGHAYSVVFTSQWDSGQMFTAECAVNSDRMGVVLMVPPQLLHAAWFQYGNDLYDVHLVVDRKYRSENRRALTVQSPSEIGSSTSGTEGSLSFEVFDMERDLDDAIKSDEGREAEAQVGHNVRLSLLQQSIEVKMDRQKKIGTLRCRMCHVDYQMRIQCNGGGSDDWGKKEFDRLVFITNLAASRDYRTVCASEADRSLMLPSAVDLHEPVDVYAHWVDQCEELNQREREDRSGKRRRLDEDSVSDSGRPPALVPADSGKSGREDDDGIPAESSLHQSAAGSPSRSSSSAAAGKKQVGGYILDQRIGRGSYAQVWRGHMISHPEKLVAVKVINRGTVQETSQLRQEVSALRKLRHENIVRFIDLRKSQGHFYLVLEYCEGGDLAQFMQARGGKLQPSLARQFFAQICAGLSSLHLQPSPLIHRDIKPQNVLLSYGRSTSTGTSPTSSVSGASDPMSDDMYVLKLADFGFARSLRPTDMAATVCGSPMYMAPEILRHERYDYRADLWSIACILYEMLHGYPPYPGAQSTIELLKRIENAIKYGSACSTSCLDLLKRVLVKDPERRMEADLFYKHPYVIHQNEDDTPTFGRKNSSSMKSAQSGSEPSREVLGAGSRSDSNTVRTSSSVVASENSGKHVSSKETGAGSARTERKMRRESPLLVPNVSLAENVQDIVSGAEVFQEDDSIGETSEEVSDGEFVMITEVTDPKQYLDKSGQLDQVSSPPQDQVVTVPDRRTYASRAMSFGSQAESVSESPRVPTPTGRQGGGKTTWSGISASSMSRSSTSPAVTKYATDICRVATEVKRIAMRVGGLQTDDIGYGTVFRRDRSGRRRRTGPKVASLIQLAEYREDLCDALAVLERSERHVPATTSHMASNLNRERAHSEGLRKDMSARLAAIKVGEMPAARPGRRILLHAFELGRTAATEVALGNSTQGYSKASLALVLIDRLLADIEEGREKYESAMALSSYRIPLTRLVEQLRGMTGSRRASLTDNVRSPPGVAAPS